LIVGNPGRQLGWISKHGHRLEFDASNRAVCPEGKDTYELKDDYVICLDE